MARLCNPTQICSKNTIYSLLVTAVWSAKLSHLSSHVSDLPPLLFLLYTPTFLLPEILVTVVGRILLSKTTQAKRISAISAAVGTFLALATWLAASSQIAFHIETGGEISWASAGNLVTDWDGFKFLVINSCGAGLCAVAIAIVAFLLRNLLYNCTGHVLHQAWFVVRGREAASSTDVEESLLMGSPTSQSVGDKEDCREEVYEDLPDFYTPTRQTYRWSLRVARLFTLAPIVILAILQIVRPKHQPYLHMSNALPFALLETFGPPPDDFCLPGLLDSMKPFPLPELLSQDYWTSAHDLSPAWHPIANWSTELANSTFPSFERPAWLPKNGTVPGFERWTSDFNFSDSNSYRPEFDPLKISNLDTDIFATIRDSLDSSNAGKIKHIVLLTLESTRADVFPLTTHSNLYQSILASHQGHGHHSRHTHQHRRDLDILALNSLLANVSPVAELLTGTAKSSGFSQFRSQSNTARPGSWRARLADKSSSLNVMGATTGSTVSLKSLTVSHCGVNPMPVEFAEEATLASYQPCLPHIFKLFNRNKQDQRHADKVIPDHVVEALHAAPWKPVVFQSMTDQFDRQDRLHAMMGFDPSNMFVKTNLTDPRSKYWPPTEPEVNYFGFPEAELKPYLRDLFAGVKEKGERLFLSHFTSGTHHPFATPESFGEDEEYFGTGNWRPESVFNNYLNTIRYQDGWLGDIMDMLDEFGMTNETLVVLVGDHGMAFAEDTAKHSNFENPHVSSFRVPLTFQHPALPPLQLHVNASSIQIIPTILDLLLASDSISGLDADVARNILPQYQGQSLIRPLKTKSHGRELWMPGVMMTGGAGLVIGSAASPYRLSIPLCKATDYRFTDLSRDPYELHPLSAWSMDDLVGKIDRREMSYLPGYTAPERQRAIEWARKAEKIARFWGWESKRLWRYSGAAEQLGRSGQNRESDGAGTIKKEHWWDT